MPAIAFVLIPSMHDEGIIAAVGELGACPGRGRGRDCCSLLCGPLGETRLQRLAVMRKTLADPIRLRLLAPIACRGSESVCTCDLAGPLGVNQPTVSHHTTKPGGSAGP